MSEDEIYEYFKIYMESDALRTYFEEVLYNSILESITGVTREEAINLAREKAGNLITAMSKEQANGIAETIANELNLGNHDVAKVAKSIKENLGLNAQRIQSVNKHKQELIDKGITEPELSKQVDKFRLAQIKDRAELIANTEIRRATMEAEKEVMQKRGAKFKKSISSKDAKVSDICKANEAQGWIDIDALFQSGSSLSPHHPDCRCAISFVSEIP